MLKKLYDKSQIIFAVVWIVAYCILMSVGDSLSEIVGIEKSVTLPVGLLLSLALICFMVKYKLLTDYGLCRAKSSAKSMLYYFPLLLMLTANLWNGVHANYGAMEAVLFIISMLCVGFLEEIIFRGLLFNAMMRDNIKVAIIVSSVTFGVGHIINLINGSGAELLPNLLQVVYATSAGFMFVMIYLKTKSLIVCILAHSIFNALSVFSNEVSLTLGRQIITCVLLTLITGSYGAYIALTMKSRKE